MKPFWLFIFLFILMTSFAFADSTFQTHKQSTNLTLIFNQDNVTSCNVSQIKFPDGSVTNYINQVATKNGQTFTFYLSANNFTNLGDTCIYYTCFNSGQTTSNNVCVNVTPSGSVVSPVQITAYILFLLVCITFTFLSFRLIVHNPYSEDNISDSAKYQLRKTNRFQFYLTLLKKKFWIVGAFGLFIFLFLFTIILNGLVFNLGLSELSLILITVNNIFAWTTIPFVIFWLGYIILYVFTETTKILQYQFGGALRR